MKKETYEYSLNVLGTIFAVLIGSMMIIFFGWGLGIVDLIPEFIPTLVMAQSTILFCIAIMVVMGLIVVVLTLQESSTEESS